MCKTLIFLAICVSFGRPYYLAAPKIFGASTFQRASSPSSSASSSISPIQSEISGVQVVQYGDLRGKALVAAKDFKAGESMATVPSSMCLVACRDGERPQSLSFVRQAPQNIPSLYSSMLTRSSVRPCRPRRSYVGDRRRPPTSR
jgi:hypothetical protein